MASWVAKYLIWTFFKVKVFVSIKKVFVSTKKKLTQTFHLCELYIIIVSYPQPSDIRHLTSLLLFPIREVGTTSSVAISFLGCTTKLWQAVCDKLCCLNLNYLQDRIAICLFHNRPPPNPPPVRGGDYWGFGSLLLFLAPSHPPPVRGGDRKKRAKNWFKE